MVECDLARSPWGSNAPSGSAYATPRLCNDAVGADVMSLEFHREALREILGGTSSIVLEKVLEKAVDSSKTRP